jgi:dUTP pyrophosphatase
VNNVPLTLTAVGAKEPSRAEFGDAAYDLSALNDGRLFAGETKLIATGVRIAIPYGYCGLVLPRSSLALNHGLTIPNAPGLIDAGYRGDVGIILHKPLTLSDMQRYKEGIAPDYFEIVAGDRYAQLLIVKAPPVSFVYSEPEFFEQIYGSTERGSGGFGSTG